MRQRLVVMRDGGAMDRNAQGSRDLQGRQLPQAAEQTLGWSPDHDDFSAGLDPHERPCEHR